MAGTRSAPTVDGSPTFIQVGVRLVDSRGDLRTVSLRVAAGTLPASIEAMVAALQVATNASVYEVQVTERYATNPLASNADNSVFESVYDNIAINFKNQSTGAQQTAFIPAPIGGLVLDGDEVATVIPAYSDFRDAVDAILDTAYEPVTARFTERREKNDSVPATAS